ncbi:unnamed protein product [Rotaria sordida]|uniref:ADP ribosyltransferase domain-containing protein n=1 Tax=Rotaria sordida TaxID=392033 RepID=A0A815TI24_9BILA|nr:unnamed protein product [Rotaria sordida]CAF1655661.1 unnamed protein product [Rotaria sordida]
MNTSELYLACRNGDIDTVKRLLPSLTLHDINRMEPNGSTALHAASYYGHYDIVKLLLEMGAVRSIINKYDMTPADEAGTLEIKLLFRRRPEEAQARFISTGHNVEWQKSAAGRAVKIAAHNLAYCNPFENMTTAYKSIVQAIELRDSKDMNQIKYFLDKACETNDASYLLRAYTAETDFYRRLNIRSAQLNARRGHPDPNLYLKEWSLAYNAQLIKDPTFQRFHWTGKTYRGMIITEFELQLYNRVGNGIVNHAFLSTSKDREVALSFASSPSPGEISVICVYTITQDWSALDIEKISEYPEEREVLIVPNMHFRITKFTKGNPIEVELQEENMQEAMNEMGYLGFTDALTKDY